ncbi:hypothetical protein C8J57DRAFT_1220768 [Mycena rebaudengoi]|nr:hypothetical protein C8J57DRAFT_1501716 [Mycena rebaudengoi]KAJ7280278.1 hypothetical protein C8J57DRAFT_1220768 [Mycena rebaudengoi]
MAQLSSTASSTSARAKPFLPKKCGCPTLAFTRLAPSVLRETTSAISQRPESPRQDSEQDIPFASFLPVIFYRTTYADRKRIRADQKAEVAAFLNEPPFLREAKLLVNLFVVENLVNNIVVATPAYEPSDALITHGENNYELDDGVDTFQQQVDDVIAAGVTDRTSTQAQDQPEQAGDA